MKSKKNMFEGDEKLQDIGLSGMNVNENPNKENCLIVSVEKVEDTPFNIVHVEEEDKAFIAVGNKRISELMSVGKCRMKIAEKEWGLLVQVMAIVSNGVYEELNIENNLKTKN